MPLTPSLTATRSRATAPLLAIAAALGILVATLSSTPAAARITIAEAPATSVGFSAATVPTEAAGAVASARTTLTTAAATVIDAGASGLDLGTQSIAIDETTDLQTTMDRLTEVGSSTELLFPVLLVTVATQTESVAAETATLRGRLDAAAAEKAAAEKAAADAAALAAANTPDGAKRVAQQIAADEFGWGGDQFSCLSSLWQKESGWNHQAYNDSSGATGIPQALPGSKMATAGADWQTNAATQIRWGLGYIERTYGSPCAAWGHSQAVNWY